MTVKIKCTFCSNEQEFTGKSTHTRCKACKKQFYFKAPSKEGSEDVYKESPETDSTEGVNKSSKEQKIHEEENVILKLFQDDTSKSKDKISDLEKSKEDVTDSLLEVIKEGQGKDIDQKTWREFINSLEVNEYGEFYQMLNDVLNSTLDTQRFKMSEKRTNILGKLTKATLLLYVPKLKPYHLLIIALIACYLPAALGVAFDKWKERKEELKKEGKPDENFGTRKNAKR